ncbi:MAG TPA: efflux RND transporter permease subunit, partial [Pyrinomonadaceae bacterium]
VEFAKMEFEKGRGLLESALEGARLRRRPLLMTSLAFIAGCLPLLFSSGSGAQARQILGSVVIGGMVSDTLIASFLIPVSFYMVEKLSLRLSRKPEKQLADSDIQPVSGD